MVDLFGNSFENSCETVLGIDGNLFVWRNSLGSNDSRKSWSLCMSEQVLTPPLARLALSPRPRTLLRLPEAQSSGLGAGTEADRPVRLCGTCGVHGAWLGSSYCCVRCRDSGGAVHGLWCSQDLGPAAANCTKARRSSFTLAAQVGPELVAFRADGRFYTRAAASQYIRRRHASDQANLEALLLERSGCPSTWS